MAFNNDDFQKMRKQRLRDRFFDSDFDKEREMFFNTSPSFQSFFNRRGDGFSRPTRPQSQPSFGKMWEEDSDGLPPNAKVRYIPVQHDWTLDPNKPSDSSEEHIQSSRADIHSSPHTSLESSIPPMESEFLEHSEIPSSSNQPIPNQPREYIIPIKILDNVSLDTESIQNSPQHQPRRGHSLNDDSRRLHANRFHLDEGRPHSTPNSPIIWPKSRHTSGPIFSQVYEPRKMETTVEKEEPKQDSKEYIIPVRMVPAQNPNSNERADIPSISADEDPHTKVNVQKLKAQFEPPSPKSSWPPLPTTPNIMSRTPHRMSEISKPEAHQERVYHIAVHEVSPVTERQRSVSPKRQLSPQKQQSPPFASQRQPSPPFAQSRPLSQTSAQSMQPPEYNRAPTPEPMKQMSAMEKIYAIEAEVREMEDSVRNFIGKKTDKHYLFLDEMFTRQLIKLDVIETDGIPEIRQARKAMVQLINELVSELENKASQSNLQQDKDTQVSQPTNIPLNVSLQLPMDDLASVNSQSIHKNENNLHVSHVEINPLPPHVSQMEIMSHPVMQVDVNKENTEKHISRVEINMDCENNRNNNSNLEQSTSQDNNCNSASSESSHMLSTSV